ncbi:MAG: VCBS domain-containing protein, partial [Sulfurimonas sp.]
LSDTHTVSAAPTDSNNLGTLEAVLVEDAILGTGVVEWTYSVENSAVQYLAEGETKTETFTVTLTDDKGASVEQEVAVTVTGTNDRPVVENIVENVSETDFVGSVDVVVDDSTDQTITVNNITYASSLVQSSHLVDADDNDTQEFGIATYSSQLGLTSDVALGVTFTEKNPGILALYTQAENDDAIFNSLKGEIIAILQNSTLLSAIVASSATATELLDNIAQATSLTQVESIINETPGFGIEANYVTLDDGSSVLESVNISAEATQAQYDILSEHNVVHINVEDTGAYSISTPFIDPLAGDEDVAITFAYNATDNSATDSATSESATVTVNVSGDNDAPLVGVVDSDHAVIGMFDMDGGNVDLSSVVEASGLSEINAIVVSGRTELDISAEDVLDVVANDDHMLTITSNDDMADAVHLDESFDIEHAYDNGDGTHTYQAEIEGTSEVVNVVIEDTIYVD